MKLPILEDAYIEEVVRAYPKSVDIFMDFGINAIVCGDVIWGTIKEEAERVELSEEKLKDLLDALNKVAQQRVIRI